ncbi:glycosyltransferase family 39 protein [Prochlorococcus marinus]|uniref:glycosyltransferase family 39 protein n=1 Tax=Prochlorococcus marinus TaxID=1219 RepID=UPI0022B5CD17|nr:glycosyltransferase family 39 protein [Prochlorococcus marinus]
MRNIRSKSINYEDNKLRLLNFLSNNKTTIIPFLFIFSYVLLYFLIDSSTQSLVAHDEGLYARRARLLLESQNWFASPFSSPHHKTLGSYWFIALSIKLFGNSEIALRLPSILASFLCLIITYLIALHITNKKSAFISVLSLSSMPLWIQYSRYTSPDITFVLSILLVIWLFLRSLAATDNRKQYIYIFSSGIFISTAFFIRSYMALVPLIGLSPFILYHLLRKKFIFKSFFFIGILIGSIPTIFNLYFSYQKFGITGITSLFDFARKQAIGGFDFNNLILTPLNYLYLTFPIGIIIILLVLLTFSKHKINYPFLIYGFPLLSLSILLCMSTSYPHYYLFLLPFLSILFGHKIFSYSFRFTESKNIIKYTLSLFLILTSCIILSAFLYYKHSFIEYSYGNLILVYIFSIVLILSYISSIRFLYDTQYFRFDLIKFFSNIVITQFISLSFLYNFGVLGNPNNKTKKFLKDEAVSNIINSNTIYLFSVDSKIQTLLSYYLPSSTVVQSFSNIRVYDYVITTDINSLIRFKGERVFKRIKTIDNHFLLMNISK